MSHVGIAPLDPMAKANVVALAETVMFDWTNTAQNYFELTDLVGFRKALK